MTETLLESHEAIQLAVELPVFNGDLKIWNQDLTVIEKAFASPEGYEFEAQLPEIIGYVPFEEIQKLRTSIHKSFTFFENGELEPHSLNYDSLLDTCMPETMRAIRQDISLLTDGEGSIQDADIYKQQAAIGEPFNVDGAVLHVDAMVSPNHKGVRPGYFFSDTQPTGFYTGMAKLFTEKPQFNGNITLGALAASPVIDLRTNQQLQSRLVQAPPLAIVRYTGATVHYSPRSVKQEERTMVRVLGGVEFASAA